MGFLRRIWTWIKSWFIVPETPEAAMERLLAEMNQQLFAAKQYVAAAVSDEIKMRMQHANAIRKAESWQKRAEEEVTSGNDEMARDALAMKKQFTLEAAAIKPEWDKQRLAVKKLQASLRNLGAQIAQKKRDKALLLARKNNAKVRLDMQSAESSLNSSSLDNPLSALQRSVEQAEAEVEANEALTAGSDADLNRRFAELEAQMNSGDGLTELKQRVAGVSTGVRIQAEPSDEDADTPNQVAGHRQRRTH